MRTFCRLQPGLLVAAAGAQVRGAAGCTVGSAWRRVVAGTGCPKESLSWSGGLRRRSRPEMWLVAVWREAALTCRCGDGGGLSGNRVALAIAAGCPAHPASSGPPGHVAAEWPVVARFGGMHLASLITGRSGAVPGVRQRLPVPLPYSLGGMQPPFPPASSAWGGGGSGRQLPAETCCKKRAGTAGRGAAGKQSVGPDCAQRASDVTLPRLARPESTYYYL